MNHKHFYKNSKKEFSDSMYLFLLQGVNYLVPLLVMPYLMITLGAEKYGYLGFSQAFIQYFILLVDFGFNLSATKRISIAKDNKDELSKIFFSTLYAKLILFIISFILFVIITFSVSYFKEYIGTLLFTFPMLLGTLFTFGWFYQGIGKVRNISMISSFSKILILPLTFLFVRKADDYNVAALIQSLVYISSALISSILLYRMRLLYYVRFSYSRVKEELFESFPLFLSSASTSMYTQLFIVILGFLASPEVVGRYSAAERIMRGLCFVFYSPINQAFYPKIASLSVVNRAKGILLIHNVLVLLFILMGFIFIALFFFSDYISAFLGKDYTGISTLLKIFAFAPFAISLGGTYGQMGLIAFGDYKSKQQFKKVYLTVAPISLVFVAILTPLFLGVGAAIALVLSEYLVLLLMYYYCKKGNIC